MPIRAPLKQGVRLAHPAGVLSLIRVVAAIAALATGACSTPTETKQPIGTSCAGQNAFCASGLCVSVDTATSICSRPCTADSDCPSGNLCGSVPSAGKVCLPGGLAGRCRNDKECSAGFLCDTSVGVCYVPVPVSRPACAPCTSSLQCPQGGFCRQDGNAQSCTSPCSTDGTCAAGYKCVSVTGATGMQCVPDNMTQNCGPAEGLCGPCRTDADCGGTGSSCVRNLASNETFCGTPCHASSDCPSSFNCTDLSGVGTGPNVCVPNSGTCVGYCDSTDPATVRLQCGFAPSCDLTSRTCEPKMDGTLCAACMTDDDCVSPPNHPTNPNASCLESTCENCPFKGQRFCSQPCSDADGGSACPEGFTCAQVGTDPSSPSFCVPDTGSCSAGAGVLGDDCTAVGPDACISGLCISIGTSSECSERCTSSADCGDPAFQCCATTASGDAFDCTQGPGPAGGICAPTGGEAGADCSRGPCYGSLCLDLGTAQVCSKQCSSSTDCPQNFTCRQGQEQQGNGATTQVQVCFPNGGGGLGADCTFGPAACQSALCLEKASGNICTQICSAATMCPAGYRCLSEALSTNSATKMTICVPNSL